MKKLEDQSTKITCRLFTRDVEMVKKRSRNEGFPWQTYLRSVVRRGLKHGDNGLSIWKFMVGLVEWVEIPSEPGLTVRGCLAVTVAETEKQARNHIAKYAAENGLDARWLEVAEVIRLPIANRTQVAWVQQ